MCYLPVTAFSTLISQSLSMPKEKHKECAKGLASPAEIKSIPNLRDVGRTINQFTGRKLLNEGVLYRSAATNDASETDRKRLKDDLGVRTILDLRIPSERRPTWKNQSPQSSSSNEKLPLIPSTELPEKIAGIDYKEVDLVGRDTKNYLLGLLGWISWLQFCVLYYVLKDHMSAKRILGRELLRKRGMNGFLIDVLDHGKAQIVEALRALTSGKPALVHCVHGKDRTGLICIIVLLAMNIPHDAISHDYHLSDKGLGAQYGSTKEYMEGHGLDESFAVTCPRLVEEVARHIDAWYEGIDGYFDSIGFSRDERQRLRLSLAA